MGGRQGTEGHCGWVVYVLPGQNQIRRVPPPCPRHPRRPFPTHGRACRAPEGGVLFSSIFIRSWGSGRSLGIYFPSSGSTVLSSGRGGDCGSPILACPWAAPGPLGTWHSPGCVAVLCKMGPGEL